MSRELCACGRVMRVDADLSLRCFICQPLPEPGWLAKAVLSARETLRNPFKPFRATHRHRRTCGEYQLLGEASIQDSCAGGLIEGDRVAIYRSAAGRLWVRRLDEFNDGRFEVLS